MQRGTKLDIRWKESDVRGEERKGDERGERKKGNKTNIDRQK